MSSTGRTRRWSDETAAEKRRNTGVNPLQFAFHCVILPLDKYIQDGVPVFCKTGGGMG